MVAVPSLALTPDPYLTHEQHLEYYREIAMPDHTSSPLSFDEALRTHLLTVHTLLCLLHPLLQERTVLAKYLTVRPE